MTEPVLDCKMAMRQLFDFLDGELTPQREAQVRMHIEICARCYPHWEFEKRVLEAIAAGRAQHETPVALRSRVMSALRDAGWSGG